MRRTLARTAARLSAVCLLAAAAAAHDVVPMSLTLRPGGEDFVYVADAFTCHADITITSLDPNYVEVYALDMSNYSTKPGTGQSATAPNRIDQVFLVRAKPSAPAPLLAVVSVCWVGVGKDTLGNDCTEDNCPAGHLVPVFVEANPLSADGLLSSGIARDPVDTATGELFEEQAPDLDLGGPMPLVFARYYASRLSSEGNATSTLGPNWTHGFAWRLVQTGWNVEVRTDRGRVIRFEKGFAATAWSLVLYEDIPYQLVQSGGGWKLLDPRDGTIRTFDSAGKLTTVEDGHGNAHTLSYAGSLLASVSDGLGRSLTLTHTAGKLTRVSDGARHVDFTYDAQGRLSTYSDAAAKVTTYAYDPAFPGDALLTAKTLPEGNAPYAQTWDAQERVATQTDADGHTYTFAYGATTAVGDPLGGGQVFDHDASGALTSLEDEAGKAASLANDSKGRRKSIDDREGGTTAWTRHAASGRVASITEADGSKTTFGYTKRTSGGLDFYDLTSIKHPDGSSESFVYDASGNLTSATDGAGHAWSFTHNARGQMLTATDPTGAVTTFVYNADGTLASVTDPAGNATSFGYDALKRADTLTRPGGASVQFGLDSLDRVTDVTDELGRTTTYVWDDNGNLTSVVNPESESTALVYDGMDRASDVTDGEGHTSVLGYEERGNPASLTNGANETASIAYDARGRVASVADSAGNTWTVAHDDEAVVTGGADPLGNAHATSSDSRGRPTRVVSPLGNATSFGWDSRGRLTRITNAKGKATKLARDADGRLLSVALPIANGTVTATRDAAGRVTALTYPGGRTWQCGHDSAGRPSSRTDPLGNVTTQSYDARNRPAQITLPGALGTVTLTWNAASELTDVVGSDGASVHYVYDDAGRLIDGDGLTLDWDDAGRLVGSDGLVLARDAAGRVTSVTYAPGKVVTYAYDAAGRLDSVTDWVGGTTLFSWDAAGRVTDIARPNGVVTHYAYDADGRVTEIQELANALLGQVPLAVTTIGYDELDRVKSVDVSGLVSQLPPLGATQRTFGAGGQLVGGTYDQAGRLVAHGGTTNAFNTLGQLESTTSNGTTTNVDYNGLGDVSRIEVVGGNTTTLARNYAFGSGATVGVLSVIRKNGADEHYLVSSPMGEPLHWIDAADDSRWFLHLNYRGWTHLVTKDDASIDAQYDYAPSGELLAHSGTFSAPLTFNARWNDYTLGNELAFVDSRPYSPRLGLFWTPDPERGFDARDSNPYTHDFTPRAFHCLPLERAVPSFADATRTARLADWPGSGGAYRHDDKWSLTVGLGYERADGPSAPAASDPRAFGFESVAGPGNLLPGEWRSRAAFGLTARWAEQAKLDWNRPSLGSDWAVLDAAADATGFHAWPVDPPSTQGEPRSYREIVEKLRAEYPRLGTDSLLLLKLWGSLGQRLGLVQADADSGTRALGGLLTRHAATEPSSVPLLKALPILSVLFAATEFDRRTEVAHRGLLLFIGATIVGEDEEY